MHLQTSVLGPNPSGYCMCGCGEKTVLAYKDDDRYGIKKNQPQRYIRGHQRRSKTPEYVVNSETDCWEWQRSKNRTGYGTRGEGLAHRIAYMKAHGYVPSEIHIDHICRNPGCVNPDHLRTATPAQNSQNRSLEGKLKSTSRFRGVYYISKLANTNPWAAKVVANGKKYYLGTFPTEEAAGTAVQAFRARYVPYSACDQTNGGMANLGYQARKEREAR